ncbi:hypothetical protein NM688_g293 [Phlebia brevispora]|uniref:Uncharacterized protein n=1 Tax=Phlebia brevispora TaxID=194682 RepID=A0ACC1TF42_9APHY|nr:hypothetical protein NM688_g293 [Phlebia brevispora]
MEYLFSCFRRSRSKFRTALPPSNGDSEAQIPVDSGFPSTRRTSDSEREAEGQLCSDTSQASTSNAGSEQETLAHSSSRTSGVLPRTECRMEGQPGADTHLATVFHKESGVGAEHHSCTESHTMKVCPSSKAVMEASSISDNHSGELSSAEPETKADLPLEPCRPESDGGYGGCRYADQSTDLSSSKVKWVDQVAHKVIELEPMECLVLENSVQNRIQMNYWAERLYGQEPELATGPLREVVIYSDETLREDAHLDISLQVKHTTTNPVIPASLADQSCTDLGVDGLLNKLNEVLRTSYSLDTPGLSPVLKRCIERRNDFGTAFGLLRKFWYGNFEGLLDRFAELERKDGALRETTFDREKGLVMDRRLIPRRVWDTFSNRVLPIWALRHTLHWRSFVHPISHSWMAEEQRNYVSTSINGFEWHVPLPNDTTLDRIRVEMLNLGAEYVWLDVVCLRQEDESKPEKEFTRKEEWMTDVPTIGYIYRSWVNIVTYFDGLGRPFHISDISSSRHWLNRAWTLQETSPGTFIGGMTETSPFPPNTDGLDATAKQFYEEFTAMAQHLYKSKGIFSLIEIMMLPSYVRSEEDEAVQAEAAWTNLVHTMDKPSPTSFIFLYPAPGNGDYTWTPTWRQLKSGVLPLPHASFDATAWSKFKPDSDCHKLNEAYILKACTIQGLGESDTWQRCRRGTLTVEVSDRESGPEVERFVVTAHHQHPIPDDQRYTLVGVIMLGPPRMSTHWMVGAPTSSGAIRKVSVVEMEDEDDRGRLDDLGLAIRTRDIPLM